MNKISLSLEHNEASAVADCIDQRLETLSSLALSLEKEGRLIDASQVMRHWHRLRKVREELSELGRQHFIGW